MRQRSPIRPTLPPGTAERLGRRMPLISQFCSALPRIPHIMTLTLSGSDLPLQSFPANTVLKLEASTTPKY